MTSKELELAIAEKVREIRDLYHKNHPKGKYLSIAIIEDEIIFHNRFLDEDRNFPIEYSESANDER